MSEQSPGLRPWQDLSVEEQTELQVGFGYYLDRLPPTCSLETKIARFRRWLEQQGVDYQGVLAQTAENMH